MKINRDNKFLPYAVCFILFFEYINYFIHTVLTVAGFSNNYTTEFLLFIYFSLLGFVILWNNKKFLKSLILPIIVLLLYSISLLMMNSNTGYITYSINEKLFIYCIPAYIIIYLIDDYESILKVLPKFAYLILFTQSLSIFFMTYFPNYFIETDYQGISYGLLIPFIYLICKQKRSIFNYIIIAYTFLLLLFFGGRGPILCAVATVLYKLLDNLRKNKLWIIGLALICTGLLYFYQDIINGVISFSEKYNLSGSLTKYYQLGDIFSDSGRSVIRQVALQIIGDHKFFGCGLGADRYYLGLYGFKYGNYPHNILLEFWIHFGVIFGSVFFIALLLYIVRAYKNRQLNPGAYALFEIFIMSTGFLILFFSSSYLVSSLFFAMLALIPKFKRRKMNETHRNTYLPS